MQPYSIQLVFTKQGFMKYISHLDLIRLFSRAVRRSGLCVKISEGFSPKYVFSIKRALKLGIESDHEEIVFAITRPYNTQEFCRQLQKELPEGITLTYVQ